MTIRPSDLSPAYQDQVLRAKSKDLARGNGPTVAPVQTWYRTSNHDSRIHKVEVVKVNPTTLIIRTETGAEEMVRRVDPAVQYHADYKSAYFSVYNRLEADREGVEVAMREFSKRNTLP